MITDLRASRFHTLLRLVLRKYLSVAYCSTNINECLWAALQLLTKDDFDNEEAATGREATSLEGLTNFVDRLLSGQPPAPPNHSDAAIEPATMRFTSIGKEEVKSVCDYHFN